MISIDAAEIGSEVEISIQNDKARAEIVPLPSMT